MIFERILPNGLELIVQRTHAPVAAIQVWVDVGSIDEKPAEAGYCHFLEHMLFKGTKKRTTQQIAGAVEGAGGEMNAFTSFEYTVYHITLSNKRWQVASDILADMVFGSTFKPSEFNPEKDVILEEISRSNDSPDRQLYQGLYQMMYGTQGYGRPVIGFPRTVKACTASGLKKFWEKWYSPSLMTVVVCGDVDPLEVEKYAMKTWGSLKRKGKPMRERRRINGFKNKVVLSEQAHKLRTFPVNSVRWAAAVPATDIRDKGLPALDVAGMILGQGDASRLYNRLFRDEHLVSGIHAGVWAPAGTGMFTFEAEVPMEKSQKFREVLLQEIDRFCKEGPTPEELERTKSSLETDRIYSQQTMDGLAHRLGFAKTSLGDLRFDLEYLGQVRDLTCEEIRVAAQTYIQPALLREFAMAPVGTAETAIWTGPQTAPSEHRIAPVVKPKVGGHERILLTNGIELLLFPKEELPLISVNGCAMGGLRAEKKEIAGIGNLIADVWDKAPDGMRSEDFAKLLEERGARISSFSGRNSLGLSGTFLSKDADLMFDKYTKMLFSPAFSEEDFSRSRNQVLEDIRTLEDDLGRLVGKTFTEMLFDDHPYAFPIAGSKESMEKLSRKAITDHFSKLVNSQRIVVSVCGKFHKSKVVSAFEKIRRNSVQDYIGGELSVGEVKGPRFVEIKKGREQSHLIVGFKGMRVTDADRYDLKVLLTLMGGQSGRLFTEIRDKKGLCYTVAPISFEGIEPGYVGVYIACDPSKKEKALEGIRLELDKLCKKAVSAPELKRSKEFLLGRHHMDLQLNASVASASALSALYSIGFDEHMRWDDLLKKVTASSLQKVARKLFEQPEVTAMVV